MRQPDSVIYDTNNINTTTYHCQCDLSYFETKKLSKAKHNLPL